jgi:hypothetical protein
MPRPVRHYAGLEWPIKPVSDPARTNRPTRRQ